MPFNEKEPKEAQHEYTCWICKQPIQLGTFFIATQSGGSQRHIGCERPEKKVGKQVNFLKSLNVQTVDKPKVAE